MLLIKFKLQGGDAEVDYSGFFILTPDLWQAFQDLAKIDTPEYIHVDCENRLPVGLHGDYTKFLAGFDPIEITDEEFKVFDKFFRKQFHNRRGILSYGEDCIWTWVFDSPEALGRLGGYSSEIII